MVKTTFAIDPGNTMTAFVLLEGATIRSFGKEGNEDVLDHIRTMTASPIVVIEMVASYGMPVGVEVFDTVRWIGRFEEAAKARGLTVHLRPRLDVKLHFCHSPKAGDANIRQALIDRYGGKNIAIGGTRCPKCGGKGWYGRERTPCPPWLHPPGPLHGITADVWQALASGTMFNDKEGTID